WGEAGQKCEYLVVKVTDDIAEDKKYRGAFARAHRDAEATTIQPSRKRRAPCRLLRLILPKRIVRRLFPSNPPTSIDGPSGSKSTHHLDASNVLHGVHPVNTAISIDGPPELGAEATHHPSSYPLCDIASHRRDSTASSEGVAYHPDTSNAPNDRHPVGTPPVSVDPPESGKTQYPDPSDQLQVGPSDKPDVTINILPDDVLLLIFHFDRASFLDGQEDDRV
ncbi:hypothetical protein BJV77DRAFT_1152554, partial [Russula vinacea]